MSLIKTPYITLRLFLFLSFSIPFSYNIRNIFIIVLVLILIYQIVIGQISIKSYNNKMLILFIFFFFLHILSLVYTTNLEKGISNIIKKLDLLFIPILIYSNIGLLRDNFSKIIRAFVIGCICAIILCLSLATAQFLITDNSEVFFYHTLSNFIQQHATYLSINIAFSSILILNYILENIMQKKFSLNNISLFFLFSLHIFFLLLLSSKSIIITFCLAINLLLAFKIFNSNFKKAFVSILVFNLLLISLLMVIPYSKKRFSEILTLDFQSVTLTEYTYTTKFTALTFRATIWKFVFQSIEKNNTWLVGVGPGDAQDVLESAYIENKVFLGIKDQRNANGFLGANAHNQYFQTLLSLGLIGLFVLILTFIIPLIISFKEGNLLHIMFMIFIISCSFTESTLETKKGILLYAFFSSLLFFCNPKKINKILE